MPWWGWVLLLWPFLAVGVTLLIASGIRLAEREERRRVGRVDGDADGAMSPRG